MAEISNILTWTLFPSSKLNSNARVRIVFMSSSNIVKKFKLRNKLTDNGVWTERTKQTKAYTYLRRQRHRAVCTILRFIYFLLGKRCDHQNIFDVRGQSHLGYGEKSRDNSGEPFFVAIGVNVFLTCFLTIFL